MKIWRLFALVLATSLASPIFASPGPDLIDRIVIDKASHRMMLLRAGRTMRVYNVALGRGGLAPKAVQGDGRVPEGIYRIVGRNARSRFYKSLRIGYPTPAQLAAARQHGIDPGDDIMIHGLPNGLGWIGSLHRTKDWTAGCIAVTDSEMDDIWNSVAVGTIVEIRPALKARAS